MARPLNILFLNHNVEWQGTFQRCWDFAKLLVKKKHQVTIVTNSPTARFRFNEFVEDSIRTVRSPDLFWGILRSGWDPVNVLRRCHFLKNRRFDIIHAFDNRPTVILPALKLKKLWKCPLVSDWCDWWGRGGAITLRKNKILNFLFSPIETYFEEHYRRYADFLTVISYPLMERAVTLGYPREKIEVIPPLAPLDKIFPCDKREAREKLNLLGYSHVLIFSGFVLYDIQIILKAFRLVYQNFPKCLLVLTGGVPKSMTEHLNLPILNTGFLSQDKLRDHLAASDLCLLPLSDCLTNRARYPYKIGRYLAAGRPVVTNPVGEVGRLAGKHHIGFLVKSTPEGFAEGICAALNQPGELDKRGAVARQVAEQYLSGEKFSETLERIYELCLSRPSSELI